jgi:hypothetical protein
MLEFRQVLWLWMPGKQAMTDYPPSRGLLHARSVQVRDGRNRRPRTLRGLNRRAGRGCEDGRRYCPNSPTLTMFIRMLFVSIVIACLAAACGGDVPPQSGAVPHMLASAATSAAAPQVFPGARADYAIAPAANGYTVTALAGGAATIVPANARLRFADISVALDLDGAAGQVYRVYRAAFDRVPDPRGIGFWIAARDQGVSLEQIAAGFMDSAEFRALYGTGLANADFVARLYRNVLHRDGEAAGIAYWTDVLQRGAATRAQVLAAFSDSAEDKAAVRDAIAAGIAFAEAGVIYQPYADAGPPRVLELGQLATLDGSASMVGAGRPITYSWSFSRRPAGSNAVLNGATGVRPSFVPDVEGEYAVALVVSDGVSASRPGSATLAGLWRPGPGRVPATGNVVYLESGTGDPVGNGIIYMYTQANAVLSISTQGQQLNLGVQGDQAWWGSFALPGAAARLVPGYRVGMGSEPWSGNGGVSWWGGLGACLNATTTWLVIDSVSYDGDTLTAVDLRFSQRCQDSGGALRGRVRWTIGDTTQPPGPGTPPAGLWRPAAGTTPANGNYVYLQSAAGDYIGQGQSMLFTDATGTLAVSASGAYLNVDVQASTWWLGTFVGMSSLNRVTPGYFNNLTDYPYNNPARGGLDWSGDGRTCAATGWFVVDNVSYAGDALARLDLRFEQHCGDPSAPALNGQIHWLAPGP